MLKARFAFGERTQGYDFDDDYRLADSGLSGGQETRLTFPQTFDPVMSDPHAKIGSFMNSLMLLQMDLDNKCLPKNCINF